MLKGLVSTGDLCSIEMKFRLKNSQSDQIINEKTWERLFERLEQVPSSSSGLEQS